MHIENKKPDNFQHGSLELQIIKQYIKKNLKKNTHVDCDGKLWNLLHLSF